MQTPTTPIDARRPPSNYQEAPDVWWGSDGIDALIYPKPYEAPPPAKTAADDAPPDHSTPTPKELISHV